ncbi:hypothetical protein ACFYWN_42975 [Streptomyces sp. NPDC002917]|uniref:hypothetical protein n=1 Tax=Streptomyces sp. NPDC002917 TaxID=3364671 RepID=UPI00369A67E7
MGTPSASPSASAWSGDLPEPGSGPSADPLIQRALDQAIPRDLPAAAERHLTDLGTRVWAADTTGTGRQQWPHYFSGSVPSAAYTRFRVQAVIARRAPGRTDKAVVHLVWAGADPSGTYLDGRTATVRFAREGDAWIPVR